MLQFRFGEAAGVAGQAASPRLLLWCRAFDDWLEDRLESYCKGTHKQALAAWKRLLSQCRKMPWELTQADIQDHLAWLQAQGYAASTASHMVGIVANFYAWCGRRRVDPQCLPGFNPAAGVVRPKVRPYNRAVLFSRGEVEALLRILKRDASPLGRREYAFFLARLRLGVPLGYLQRLQWGQISRVVEEAGSRVVEELGSPVVGDQGQAWVCWRTGAARVRLPGEVWEAILDYLEASGRLAGMRAEAYIFAPLAEPGKPERGAAAGDWLEDRCLVGQALLENLRLYGKAAGIPEHKLTLQALRRTAIRLRMDGDACNIGYSGDAASLQAMQVFMDCREQAKLTKHKLSLLPQLPQDEQRIGEQAEDEPPLPDRQVKPFKPGEGLIHGLYANSQPMEAVLEVLAENIKGIDDELACMRILGRGLTERLNTASPHDQALLSEAYFDIAYRVGTILEIENERLEDAKDEHWGDDFLVMLDEFLLAQGSPPVSEAVRREALQSDPELEVLTKQTAEEIATARYLLRNLFRVSMEAVKIKDFARWTSLYSTGFIRMAKLIDKQPPESGRLEAYLTRGINQALEELMEEWGIGN